MGRAGSILVIGALVVATGCAKNSSQETVGEWRSHNLQAWQRDSVRKYWSHDFHPDVVAWLECAKPAKPVVRLFDITSGKTMPASTIAPTKATKLKWWAKSAVPKNGCIAQLSFYGTKKDVDDVSRFAVGTFKSKFDIEIFDSPESAGHDVDISEPTNYDAPTPLGAPSYPGETLRTLLRNRSARVVLIETHHSKALPLKLSSKGVVTLSPAFVDALSRLPFNKPSGEFL